MVPLLHLDLYPPRPLRPSSPRSRPLVNRPDRRIDQAAQCQQPLLLRLLHVRHRIVRQERAQHGPRRRYTNDHLVPHLLHPLADYQHTASHKVAEVAAVPYAADFTSAALRTGVAALLHTEVAAMNLESFVVRAKRRLVEKYSQPEAWAELKEEARAELAHEVAGLPSEPPAEDEEAKRFDLLILSLQLAILRAEPS